MYNVKRGSASDIIIDIFRKEVSFIPLEIVLALKLGIPKLLIMDQKQLHI